MSNVTWDAPTILEAMGRNPATCDEVYQVAAAVLADTRPADGADFQRVEVRRPRRSKAPPVALAACLSNWSSELGLGWAWAHVWPDKRGGMWTVLLATAEPAEVTNLHVVLADGTLHSRLGDAAVVTMPPQPTLFGAARDVGTVLMDPPWPERGGGKIQRGADRHYPLLNVAEMPGVIRSCEHWDRLADDAHCYMWVTNNYLPDGLWLLNKLGFRYVTNLVWTKDRVGLGQYFRGQHELVLFGVRGKPPLTDGTWSTWLGQGVLRRGRHSEKPRDLHYLIEQASPGRWLEIFAREQRDNWLAWGNEV